MEPPSKEALEQLRDRKVPVDCHTLRIYDDPSVDFILHEIIEGSDEGRAYAKLTTDAERLEFMRNHYHDTTPHVSPDQALYQDSTEGKRWIIEIKSPEGEEIERLRYDGNGKPWPKGSKEYEIWLKYFKEHAHSVEELSKEEIPVCKVVL